MYHFFVNPASRSGNGAVKWNEVETYLKAKKISYEVHFLQAKVSPRPIMEAILKKEGAEQVPFIVIGGDGTINQCINGIPDFDRILFSVIPTGSGNDFCRNKNLPHALSEQLNNILTKKHQTQIDRGVLTYHKTDGTTHTLSFLVSTGLGYDAAICYMAERSSLKQKLNKIKLGKLVYIILAVKEIFHATLTDMEITVDGVTKQYKNVFFVTSMNQPFEGGGVAMTPDASDCDETLDFIIYHNTSRLRALCTIPLLYIKKHIGRPGVTMLTGKEIRIVSSGSRIVHYDGESEDDCTGLEAKLEGKITLIH